jgi:hypothetical protein
VLFENVSGFQSVLKKISTKYTAKWGVQIALPVNINCGNAFSNTLQDEWWIYEELLFIM